MWLRKITLILRNECGRHCGLMVSALDSGSDGLSSSPGRDTALCSWARPEPCVTMHKVAWHPFRHAVYIRIHVYASGHEKVSSRNLGSGTLADKTPTHWPSPTENWLSDPQSELLDWQNPETGPKLSDWPAIHSIFQIRELFKAKSADPRTYSPPSKSILSFVNRKWQV